MDRKTFILAALIIILVSGIASAAYATYQHSAFKIGDAKDIDMNNQSIGNATNFSSKIANGVINAANYPTIQAAINNASTNNTVYIPCGVYNQTVNITKRITLMGCGGSVGTLGVGDAVNGKAGTVLQQPLNSDNVVTINFSSSVEGIVIKDLAIWGNSLADPGNDLQGNGIFINGSGTGIIEKVWVEKMSRNGAVFNNTAQGWWVIDLYSVNNRQSGVLIKNQSHANMFTNVHSEGNNIGFDLRGDVQWNKFVGSWAWWSASDGFRLSGDASNRPRYNQFSGIDSSENDGDGIDLSNSDANIFSNVILKQNDIYGLSLSVASNNSFTAMTAESNSFSNPGSYYNFAAGTSGNNNTFMNIQSLDASNSIAGDFQLGGGIVNTTVLGGHFTKGIVVNDGTNTRCGYVNGYC